MSSGASADPARRAPSNLRLRVLSSIVLIAAATLLTWLGGLWFALFCALIGAAVFHEWAAITQSRSASAHQLVAAVLLAAVLMALLLGWLTVWWVVGALALCAVSGLAFGRWGWTTAGLAYALASALPLALLRGDAAAGLATVLLLFAVVWATDILAYFVGRALGGPKLAPAISPGKTWSGALGGAAGAVLAGLLTGWLLGIRLSAGLVAVLLILSVVSQAGDLFESWVKRRFAAKDSGAIIPGHGGVMDRVDGLVAAALALYLIEAAARSGGPDWGLPL
ncbi:MAG TPA: phosphatidate cytidylyltransferase [Mesorhizobium sp.]|nr:phosphatidate cytidylyltransferase [Mesorhizobium sp.]